jgi:putative nucleotidyltransferase with HDIG domain
VSPQPWPHWQHCSFLQAPESAGIRAAATTIQIAVAVPAGPVLNPVVNALIPGGGRISTSIRWYIGLLAAGAAALLLYLGLTSEPLPWMEFALFLTLFLVAESKPVVLPKSRTALTLTFIVGMVAIIRTPPAAVAIASALGVMAFRPEGHRLPISKLIFNSAQASLAAGLAALAYRGLGGSTRIEPETLDTLILATAAATLIYFVVNTTAVTGAIAISTGSPFVRTWFNNHGWMTATYVAFGASGIVLAGLYQVVGLVALPLLIVPLLVARAAFHSYQEVSDAYDSTVRAFVRAIDAKDAYTRGHSERVAEYGKMIAERTGMSESEVMVFYYGALLHDIGKLVIRKEVLTKPDSLTKDEWHEVKRHPILGAQIVQDIDFLRESVDSVLSHHERLDGSGYPAGLAGDLVRPWARIMGVADSYDAMTSTRAYRGSRTNEEAIAELKRCSGTLYDPRYVQAFVEALADLEEAEEVAPRYETKAIPRPAR